MELIRGSESSERGSALLVAVITTTVLCALGASMLAVGVASNQEHIGGTDNMRSLYVAEAGLNRGIDAIMRGAAPSLGSSDAPTDFSNGSYWGSSVESADHRSHTLTVYGTSRGKTRGLEATVAQSGEGIYSSAVFAGNTANDPTYDLKFGGTGTQADNITGNVYSGQNVRVAGTATIAGTTRAHGTITGTTGETGVTLPVPNLAAMNYPVNNNVNVAAAFSSGAATYTTNNSYGGRAWQLPESNPAHIFRKNPNDRTSNTSSTVKDDYFLEDVYEPINASSTVNRANGSHVTIAGVGGEPGASGNNLVYYIDGNLWVHNNNAFSFTLWNATDTQIKVTIVVRGNIYISDNIFYDNPNQDGLALIAMKDSGVTDSGNIYFGDPTFGTLEYMDAFMYAENNFLDNNLSASGSARVTVHGNMTAGNQVKINRDYGTQHSKLTVNFDDRVWNGSLELPGLPTNSGAGATWRVETWREIAAP